MVSVTLLVREMEQTIEELTNSVSTYEVKTFDESITTEEKYLVCRDVFSALERVEKIISLIQSPEAPEEYRNNPRFKNAAKEMIWSLEDLGNTWKTNWYC